MLKNDMNLTLPFIILNNDEVCTLSVKHGTNSRFDNISYFKAQKQRGVEALDNRPALSLH